MLYYTVIALHVLVCLVLVLVVLLQSGKGADLAGAFGGGATQTAFGSRGPASFLSRMTTIAAVVFMVTSISLSLMSSPSPTTGESKSVLETTKGDAAQPADGEPAAAPKSQEPVPTPDQIRKMQEEIQARQKQESAEPAPAPAPAAQPAE
ncbi:MAG: preprotein translocase subunit SecG [Acidobacteriota bacterium]|jgi:preprotein translocase subunit SecG|nr:preprotein translocase subunit SecG [Acidobacteriota bacterium]NLT32737.1 preprotein translocase subunit SecG [Acidobacteriota bacterium]